MGRIRLQEAEGKVRLGTDLIEFSEANGLKLKSIVSFAV